MKTAIIGASGYIGSHLLRAYRLDYPDCIGTRFTSERTDLAPFDLRSPDLQALNLVETDHTSVLIAAAETSISKCQQSESETAMVNVQGTLELIDQCNRLGLSIIYLSSDNVFDGNRAPYDDNSIPSPISAYGKQKLQIENAIFNRTRKNLVVRLSKVYGLEKGDGTLFDQIAESIFKKQRQKAAFDLLFNPTWIEDIVKRVRALQASGIQGKVNLCSPQAFSRYDLSMLIAEAMKANPALIEKVVFSDIDNKIIRPLDTRLRCSVMSSIYEDPYLDISSAIAFIARNWQE